MAIQPNEDLLSNPTLPRITLAGKVWPVPKLAIAQNVIVGPIVARRMKQLGERQGGDMLSVITPDFVEDLAMACFQALLRGHASLKRAEYDDMPVDVLELVDALPTIAQQTGLFKPAKTGDAPPPLAPTAGTSPTGTP